MELLTSSELEAVNGTDVRLKCTFKSTHPLSEERVSVSWSFRPLGKTAEESVRQNGCGVKGIVHPKIKILSSFTHPQVVLHLYECFFLLNTKEDILKKVCNQAVLGHH